MTDRRASPAVTLSGLRYPSWPEQQIQFITRYVFLMLGVLFFNLAEGVEPAYWSLPYLNAAFATYLVLNTAFFLDAGKRHIYPLRYHAAMWVDIALTSICVLNDPHPIPPSLLVYIMVALGNGMRYGMRLFAESLIGCFGAAMLVLSMRHLLINQTLSPGLLFLNLFGGIILVYAYILMDRIDRSRSQLEQNSNIDVLTGLLNRRALQDLAHLMFQRLHRGSHRVVMLFADLDRFKAVNDALGHATGDRVLQQFADILRGSLRSSDIAARFGGDEFIVLLEEISLEEAEIVATRIQDRVSQWAEDNRIDFSVTFGLGEAPTHGDSFFALLERVDQALYHSKCRDTGGGLAYAQCGVFEAG